MSPARDYESRITALEKAIYGNPGFAKQGGVDLATHFEAQCRAFRDGFEAKLVALEKAADARAKEQRDFFDTRLAAFQRAVDKAADEEKAKFLTVNEFRGTLTDYTSTLASKDKVDAMFTTVADRVGALERAQSKAEGKASQSSVTIVGLMAAPGLIIAVITLVKMLSGG